MLLQRYIADWKLKQKISKNEIVHTLEEKNNYRKHWLKFFTHKNRKHLIITDALKKELITINFSA